MKSSLSPGWKTTETDLGDSGSGLRTDFSSPGPQHENLTDPSNWPHFSDYESVIPGRKTSIPPKVTALVSTHNAERFMRGCLEDLVAQTISDQLEIIVVDSASPQNERHIVQEFQKQFPNIHYVRTARREGLYAAWNRAIKIAQGDFLTNANTDDRHAPHALETMAHALKTHPDAGVVYAGTAITQEENGRFGSAPGQGFFKARRFDRRRLFYDCLPGPQPMWRRGLHDRFGYFDENFVSAGDYEFWLRISGEVKFIHIPEVLGLFLDSPESLSHKKSVTNLESEQARDRHWPKEWGIRPKDHRSLLNKLTRRSTYREWMKKWLRQGK